MPNTPSAAGPAAPTFTAKPENSDPTVMEMTTLTFGVAPAMALSSIYSSMASSLGILYQNAVAAQQAQSTSANLAMLDGAVLMNAQMQAASKASTGETDPIDTLAAMVKKLKSI